MSISLKVSGRCETKQMFGYCDGYQWTSFKLLNHSFRFTEKGRAEVTQSPLGVKMAFRSVWSEREDACAL